MSLLRIFSGRNRLFSAGPLPTEVLPRSNSASRPDSLGLAPAGAEQPGPWSFTKVLPAHVEVFVQCRHAEVAASRAPMPSLEVAGDNLKGYAFFLDADLAGACRIPSSAWQSEAESGHTHALAIAIFRNRPPRPEEPGHAWISGGGSAVAGLRAMETATVLSRYLGTLGYSATAHSSAASDLDLFHVAWSAGLIEAGSAGWIHPFAKYGLELAVVSTDLELPVDLPLAPRSFLTNALAWFRFQTGFGGTRPGWSRLSGENRPWHLGSYPMERVPRRNEPTTLIVEDEVERVPERHSFYNRAAEGDLGEKLQREFSRFISKAPHGYACVQMLAHLAKFTDGPVAGETAPGSSDPEANTLSIKALARFLGAQITAVCEAPEYAWYSHRADGTPVEARHRWAIVFIIDQGRETMEGASGDDWIAGAQSIRSYLRASVISGLMANHIRRLGHEATGHHASNDELNHIPLLLLAGIGELSRIGELVLNPFIGPRFKSGVITTNLPLVADKPIDFGLQDFCSKCNKCARECPVGAIRFGEKTMFNGYEMWKPDVHRCASYRLANSRGSGCGRCMKACPYNTEGTLAERPFQWLAMHVPAARGFIARLDDRVGNGGINPQKKWWIDIETVDGNPVPPVKGAHQRELQLDRAARPDEDFALFPPEVSPSHEQKGPFQFSRKVGIDAAAKAESPLDARARAGRQESAQ